MSFLSKLKAGLGSAALLSMTAVQAADSKLNMREGVTVISRDAYSHHNMTMLVMLIIAILVFGAMAYAMVKFRRSAHPKPATWSHSTLLEVIWTAIPFIILIALAVPATRMLIEHEDTSEADMSVVVRGYQWKWRYTYQDTGLEYFSNLATPRDKFINSDSLSENPFKAVGNVIKGGVITAGNKPTEKDENYLLEVDNELVLPIGKKIRFLITAEDVIHSWWVPDFGIKKDAIPGFVNESWARIEEPGIYRGVCAELCGKDHGFMPIVVRAVSAEEYDSWMAKKLEEKRAAEEAAAAAAAANWSLEDLMAEGEKVYNRVCAACHKPDGTGLPPTFPALKGSGMAVNPDQVNDHINIVVYGKAGSMMQAFGAQLSDLELAAVITYERNAWGNNTGQTVQPADIAAVKQGK